MPTSPQMTAENAILALDSLDLSADQSTLNPNAPAFVPSWHVDDDEGALIDDAMKVFHHLATVNDSDSLGEAKAWLGANPDEWAANGAEYIADVADEGLASLYDREAHMLDGLYQPPNKPKGNTAGRARAHH